MIFLLDNVAWKLTLIKITIFQWMKIFIIWFHCLETFSELKKFNDFSLIGVHQCANLSDSFEGGWSRVIGNHCKYRLNTLESKLLNLAVIWNTGWLSC